MTCRADGGGCATQGFPNRATLKFPELFFAGWMVVMLFFSKKWSGWIIVKYKEILLASLWFPKNHVFFGVEFRFDVRLCDIASRTHPNGMNNKWRVVHRGKNNLDYRRVNDIVWKNTVTNKMRIPLPTEKLVPANFNSQDFFLKLPTVWLIGRRHADPCFLNWSLFKSNAPLLGWHEKPWLEMTNVLETDDIWWSNILGECLWVLQRISSRQLSHFCLMMFCVWSIRIIHTSMMCLSILSLGPFTDVPKQRHVAQRTPLKDAGINADWKRRNLNKVDIYRTEMSEITYSNHH